MPNSYKNVIFTNHAYERIKSRSLSADAVYETIQHPDKKYTKSNDSFKYIKTILDRKYHVVATYKPDQKKHLVISAWVRGEEDKAPLSWRLLILPLKIIWWLVKLPAKIAKNIA